MLAVGVGEEGEHRRTDEPGPEEEAHGDPARPHGAGSLRRLRRAEGRGEECAGVGHISAPCKCAGASASR
ncbi:hypothetical protein GCM10010260_48600 [Streptomyces filipinensis]|uniref:Uncharacterized protein n=1 Tax=Streptomyces filipinensis TaxID=66887 RepID=A0A918IF97_9ACTN|nr:hypothetical protein GCM10010260_48600 [Streptomyces filipinensis]